MGLLADLKALGFDRSYVVPFEPGATVGCSECQAIAVNGVPCHEAGCPNAAKVRTCPECDDVLEETGRGTPFCPSCDTCPTCGCPAADGFTHHAGCDDAPEEV